MWSALLSRLKTLNVFASFSTANNEYELKNERISTRIFISMLVICILILVIYSAQVSVSRIIEVKYPQWRRDRGGGVGEGTPPALESFDCNFLRIGDFLTIVFSEIGRI
jgi:hypothetical protein